MAAFCGSKSINSVSRSSDLSRMASPRLLTLSNGIVRLAPEIQQPDCSGFSPDSLLSQPYGGALAEIFGKSHYKCCCLKCQTFMGVCFG